jgi:Holliday junction resolvase RusA-like endonuclease
MRKLTVEIPGQPIPWTAPKVGKHGNLYSPKEYSAWKEAAAWHILAAAVGEEMETPCQISITIYSATQACDGTNILKACEDAAVKSGILSDDNLLRLPEAHRKFGGVDKENPRVLIELESE